jgi:hypothetical protein
LLLFGSLLSELQVLLPSSILLSLEFVCFNFLSLFFEDGLNQDGSVFELITLGGKIEFVVESAINFFGLTILPKKSSKDSLPPDP